VCVRVCEKDEVRGKKSPLCIKQQYTATHSNTLLQCVATVYSYGNKGEGRGRMRRERVWGQKRGGGGKKGQRNKKKPTNTRKWLTKEVGGGEEGGGGGGRGGGGGGGKRGGGGGDKRAASLKRTVP